MGTLSRRALENTPHLPAALGATKTVKAAATVTNVMLMAREITQGCLGREGEDRVCVCESGRDEGYTCVRRRSSATQSGMCSPKTTATVVVRLVALVKEFVNVLKFCVRNVVDLNNKQNEKGNQKKSVG